MASIRLHDVDFSEMHHPLSILQQVTIVRSGGEAEDRQNMRTRRVAILQDIYIIKAMNYPAKSRLERRGCDCSHVH